MNEIPEALSKTISSSAGGTALYIHESISRFRRSDLSSSVYSAKLIESTFVEIKRRLQLNLIIGCIYKHPPMKIDDFNDHYLSPLLDKIYKEGKDVVLLGDFNINLPEDHSSSEVSNFIDILQSNFLMPTITLPTIIFA